jgi:hypothetical protein
MTTATAAQPTPSPIVGFVDAIVGDTIYGWAWNRKAPDEHLTIHIRIGEEEIGTTTADQERDDLKENRVGDGRHAFVFRLPPDSVAEIDRVEVSARSSSGGGPVPLAMPPVPKTAGSERADNLQELVGRLMHSHRVLHRTLQSGFAGLKDSTASAGVSELRAAQTALSEQMRNIEVFIVRLDGVVQELSGAVKGLKRRSSDPTTVALLVLLTLAAGGSFGLELLRFFM